MAGCVNDGKAIVCALCGWLTSAANRLACWVANVCSCIHAIPFPYFRPTTSISSPLLAFLLMMLYIPFDHGSGKPCLKVL
ncbi:hypothetical protein BU26DRAFT_264250 [Trematosphaeria pertusa]|uniref:Uncharacterized protein n=1 Tax=Trematosphaeria pertusa TaxID=390896 RepID=A0A6A6IK84_9PLEO|nr:uncharacterized protein BU26DRAFT_264250 [Trematosphaeria pertusa]KAF2250488.1 hypothetical protein BU26DRAFT_264250 [Trematosphaeria pertusa]